MFSAFIIGSGFSTSAALAAGGGKLNSLAVMLIFFSGLTAAAKDYRSLMRLPPVETNGVQDSNQPKESKEPK